ncbi:single-stranded DNA-binding protein [Myxococcota bacterium]|nr:single-stranded DNA-binding protein [Myxococcota bacterium]
MKTQNQVMLVGYVGRPPKITQTQQGDEIASFSVATHRAVRDGDGFKDVPEWHPVVAFPPYTKIVAQLLGKGDAVVIVGDLRQERWRGADGAPRTASKVVVRSLSVLSQRRENLSRHPAEPVEPVEPGALA